MSRLVAFEWDAKELRVLAGRKRGRSAVVDRAWTIPLSQAEGGESEVGVKLAELVQKEGLARSETLVAVGRSNIELRLLSTPPAPPEEIPEMVRFQALRQFTTLGDDWPLDYLDLGKGADGGTNVLAAAISPELMRQIQKVCQKANLQLKHVSLRPVAAASLLVKQHTDDRCRMIIDLLPGDADLSVLIGPQVIYPRTVRLAASIEPAIQAKSLVGEIRRTVIAAQNQLGGRRVEEVAIFGDGLHHAAVKSLIEKELNLEVKLLDPFSYVDASSELTSKPEFPGTFAPLLGMLEQECAKSAETIDFLAPRKRPIPPNKRRQYILFAGVAFSIVACFAAMIYWELGALDTKISSLRNQLERAKAETKKSKKPRDDAEQLERFTVGDIAWLDALDILSRKMPSAKQARVEELSAISLQPVGERLGGGRISVQGLASETGVINQMELQARSVGYDVSGSGAKFDSESPDLKWRFKEEFSIYPEKIAEIEAQLDAEDSVEDDAQQVTTAGDSAAGVRAVGTPNGAPDSSKTSDSKSSNAASNAAVNSTNSTPAATAAGGVK